MSSLVVVTSIVGIVFSVAGLAVFPFQPSIVSGVLALGASLLSITAALTTLCCCQQSPNGAHNAALMCMVIQLMSTASLLYAASGTSWDFCSDTRDCYYLAEPLPCEPFARTCWDKNPYDFLQGDIPTRKNCEPEKSYFCYDRMPEDIDISFDTTLFQAYVASLDPETTEACEDFASGASPSALRDLYDLEFSGPYKRNCEARWKPCGDHSKNDAQSFWGFDDREDCMKYYMKQNKIWPTTSTSLIACSAMMQIVFSFFLMYYSVLATNL